MLDKTRLTEILVDYKKDFAPKTWGDEKYKWVAVKTFQDNWDIDAPDFAEMLERALSKTENLLTSLNHFPKGMITEFAQAYPEEVKSMFRGLFDESKEIISRISEFKRQSDVLHKKFGKGNNHYQDENAVCTYLWLRFPDKYFLYKYGEVVFVAKEINSDYVIKKGRYEDNIKNFNSLYNEIRDFISIDTELIDCLKSQLTEDCYSDPRLITLTVDVGYYISIHYRDKEKSSDDELSEALDNIEITDEKINGQTVNESVRQYWWLNANPKVWSFSGLEIGKEVFYTLYNESGHKRRVFQNFINAKVGDIIIGYESNPTKKIVAICKVSAAQDGEKIYFEKLETLPSPIDYATLKDCPELQDMEYFVNPNGSFFKLTEEEYDFIMDVIREENPKQPMDKSVEKYDKADFLNEVYITESEYDKLVNVLKDKKNIILQGAPGVGKTYAAKRLAYSIMGNKDDDRIEFVQFHQNYSYEDFVMGYKPADEGFKLKNGVFYNFCVKASNYPDKDFFFIIDEINRGNLSKIFGELLMLVENTHRGEKTSMTYSDEQFSVPDNLYIIGMMNTADRSLAMIDYALRRRFSFFEMKPAFDSDGFRKYQYGLADDTFNKLIDSVKRLNAEIEKDDSLGRGFCIGHSYFCNWEKCTDEKMRAVVDFEIIPMLEEYWFDESGKVNNWRGILHGIF